MKMSPAKYRNLITNNLVQANVYFSTKEARTITQEAKYSVQASIALHF